MGGLTTGGKAATCWVALIALALLNPTPTGGALLVIAPLGVATFYTSCDWVAAQRKETQDERPQTVHRHRATGHQRPAR